MSAPEHCERPGSVEAGGQLANAGRHVLGQPSAAFAAGVVLYTGQRAYTYDDGLHVLPIDRISQPSN
ncbi:hypothetical protein BH23ACT9_BH23ACT9_34890 [soil metagenome]